MHNQILLNKYHFIDNLDIHNIENLSHKIILIYRNYKKKVNLNKLITLRNFCRKTKRKLFIANEIEIAYKYKLDGAYIPSFNKKIYTKNYFLNNKFKLIGSAHNYKEIIIKEKQGVSLIFLSPIFKTYKNVGIIKFINLSNYTRKPVIALGGINNDNIKSLKLINLYGFAAIRYFKDNKTK
jgi:thiamine-phosphate pyrophosphorylase